LPDQARYHIKYYSLLTLRWTIRPSRSRVSETTSGVDQLGWAVPLLCRERMPAGDRAAGSGCL